ncbi:unnamed protein product [Darwinula stevensoni]|uniref:p53 DNA-binding domain-containing protein n=1 Tax=Darwinula stevensoni TaxID=69355 RepID=A0A7R9A701_9CRUS|nr:unnamed protein product [Darwinula stevensoni]CAG0890894.1 unnamed protein product [Darwinula stevensoni]
MRQYGLSDYPSGMQARFLVSPYTSMSTDNLRLVILELGNSSQSFIDVASVRLKGYRYLSTKSEKTIAKESGWRSEELSIAMNVSEAGTSGVEGSDLDPSDRGMDSESLFAMEIYKEMKRNVRNLIHVSDSEGLSSGDEVPRFVLGIQDSLDTMLPLAEGEVTSQEITCRPAGSNECHMTIWEPIGYEAHTVDLDYKMESAGILHDPVPATTNWEGYHGFTVSFPESTSFSSGTWTWSAILGKLFVEMKKTCPFQVHIRRYGHAPLCIRAMMVYASPHYIQYAVNRCPHHAEPNHVSNKGYMRNEELLQHVVRADHQNAKYERSSRGRHSVVIPLDRPSPGTEFTTLLFQFSCLGSCPGGINGRTTKLLLTLETRSGEVVGRSALDLKICACPLRDRRQEERKVERRRDDCSVRIPAVKRTVVKGAHPHSYGMRPQGRDDPHCETFTTRMAVGILTMQDMMQFVDFLHQRHPHVFKEYEQSRFQRRSNHPHE